VSRIVDPRPPAAAAALALPAQSVQALRTHRAAQLEERIAAGTLWQDHDLVFAQPYGRPIERTSDWRAWKTS
jgi:integrase